MKQPNDIHDALTRIHQLLAGIAILAGLVKDASNPNDRVIESYPEYFEPIKDAALDAHLLVTWVKDQLSYPPQT